MADREYLEALIGNTVYFHLDHEDVITGKLMGFTYPEGTHGVIETDRYAALRVPVGNIFATKEGLYKRNYNEAVKLHDDHVARVHEYQKDVKTVREFVQLYKDYKAIKDALKVLAVDLFGTAEPDVEHLFKLEG